MFRYKHPHPPSSLPAKKDQATSFLCWNIRKSNQKKVEKVLKYHCWRKRPIWQCRLVAPTSKTGTPPGLSRRMKRWTFLFPIKLKLMTYMCMFIKLNLMTDMCRCTSNCWTFYTQHQPFNLQQIQVPTIHTEVMSLYTMYYLVHVYYTIKSANRVLFNFLVFLDVVWKFSKAVNKSQSNCWM